MVYVDIIPSPGVHKDVDEYSAGPRWINTEKVRFDLSSGLPEKIGGWTHFSSTKVEGTARTLHDWRELDGDIDLAVGTNCFLYVFQGDTAYNITPYRTTLKALSTTPFATGAAGSSTVTVTHSSHGAETGEAVFFTFSTGTSKTFDSVTLSEATWYTLTKVDANSYTITGSGTAASGSTTSSAAGTVKADYSLSCGPSQTAAGLGWGASTWGASTWGEARSTSSIALNMQIWSMDNWGEDLIAAPIGGGVYLWDASSAPSTANLAASLSNAPSQVNLVGVSPDRHAICFGCHDGSNYDPLLVRWSDQEDNTTWTASATNTAGSKRIESGTKIVAWEQAARQILIFTDESMWGMQFLGPPFVFGFQEIGKKCGAAGPNAVTSLGGATYWLGRDNFFMYDGAVKVLPSTIRDFVFDNIDRSQIEQAFATTIREFNEVWFFYPSDAATMSTADVDSYAVYNAFTKTWFNGTLDRLAWIDTRLQTRPISVDSTGQLYYQEDGSNDVSAAINASCETGVYEFEKGNNMLFIDKILPAFKDMTGTMTFTAYAKQYPNATERTKARSITASTKITRPRVRGRQFRFKWQTSDVDNAWTLGKWRASPKPDGDR